MLIELPTERLILKVLDDSYVKKVNDYFVRNRSHLCVFNPLDNDKFYNLDIRRKILLFESMEHTNMKFLRFWIFKKSDKNYKKIIGTLSFSNIVHQFTCSCTLGYSIDKDEINKGYITEALSSAIDYIFKVYRIHRVEASVMESNVASVKVLKKLGFHNEGTMKKYININGVWEDHMRMTLINPLVE